MYSKAVLEKAREEGEVLTFDDVTLKEGYAEVMPKDVDVTTRFTRNIGLKIPMVSAAMDTVTEAPMAIELAKLGGIGVIHKNLTIEEQAEHVARVKHNLHGFVDRPTYVKEDDRVESILAKGYKYRSFPVINGEGKLVGIVTGNDFDFCTDNSVPVSQIMSRDLFTMPVGTDINAAYEIMTKRKKKILPIMNGNGTMAGMFVYSDVKRVKTRSNETYTVDSKNRLRVAAAVGTGDKALERIQALVEQDVDAIVIDTAHADSKPVKDTLIEAKRVYHSLEFVVGNVSSRESAERVLSWGADAIKIGQGPGSICTTRIVAGIGRPQISAVYDCYKAIGDEIPLCADGGLRFPGDIVKAIAAGAHYVMMGKMLAGTDEAPGDIIFVEGRQFKTYRGMGSLEAMQNEGSKERYHETEEVKDRMVPEGVSGRVPYKGKLATVMIQYVGGLRKGMGYVGAATIEQLREKGDFDKMTNAGISESHPHDVEITSGSPNYSKEK
ncbi:IMP dehydrogenase [Candidatus Gottesmanbacteria bacterium]|nr:IMP dehydrogenase [Candidatus Gottesmanbacteria bacterium]